MKRNRIKADFMMKWNRVCDETEPLYIKKHVLIMYKNPVIVRRKLWII